MYLDELKCLLVTLGQEHLGEGIETLSLVEQKLFLQRVQGCAPLLEQQKRLLAHPKKPPVVSTPDHFVCDKRNRESGEMLIKEGKVGSLILAGGQGSRLGFNGPKGAFPVTPVTKKSLFQVLLEKVRAASLWAGKDLPVAVMTSPLNHEQTCSFFEKHAYFGLDQKSVSLFEQEKMPFIDEEGRWMLKKPGLLAEGPNGNGLALHRFFSSGLWEQWQKQGIEYVNVIFVDNPLVNPFDSELIGAAVESGSEVVLKAVERKESQEQMGVVASSSGKLCVVEYLQLPDSPERFSLSSTGTFCLSMPFIERLYSHAFDLHLTWKDVELMQGVKKMGKCEYLLFDLLRVAERAGVFVAPREEVYAPLKDAKGERDLSSVQRALVKQSRSLYKKLTGKEPQVNRFELSSEFYYASDTLKEKLKGYPLSEGEYLSSEQLFCYLE